MNAPTELVLVADADYDRRAFIGSSNAAAIMGVGAYGATPVTTYLAKIGEGAEEVDPKRELFLQRRKRWEGPIVDMLREEFAGQIVGVNQRYIDPEHPFIAAEIDFEWLDDQGEVQNGEIKTVSPFAFGEQHGWGEPGTADIPVHYAAQVMHSLGVTRRQTCIVAALVGLDTMLFYRVERDEETIAAIREEEVRFWTEHVLPRNPPDPISYEDTLKIASRLTPRPVELDGPAAKALADLQVIRGTMKALEGDESECKLVVGRAIVQAWGLQGDVPPGSAELRIAGVKVGSWNEQTTARIDAERLREQHPDIAAACTKSSTTRVLRISKTK